MATGELRLIPAGSTSGALADDHVGTPINGMSLDDSESLEAVVERCADARPTARAPAAQAELAEATRTSACAINAFAPRDRRVEGDASNYPPFRQDRRFKDLRATLSK